MSRRLLSEAEIKFILENFDSTSQKKLAKKLGISMRVLRRTLIELGLIRSYVKPANNSKIKVCPVCGKTFVSKRTRKYCSKDCFLKYKRSNEYREMMRQIMSREEVYERIANKLRGERNPFYGKTHTEETKKRISEKIKKKLEEDPEYRKKVLEASYKGWMSMAKIAYDKVRMRIPNRSEERLLELIEAVCPGEYKYNRWEYVIAGKIPDFVDINGKKKLIELFGDAFHDQEEEPKLIEHYKKHGWDCLVIWASELINATEVMRRIEEFNRR